ncbi:2-dehydropantoate 2-reductase [Cylindrobasidium torrendii FP15055 ss-10]|uniref:2-dehydropantoate 2-reductase n=1 Tax=Cylindrobasidium torrendii FP15055 ss-10 TaxID=1314674 RepID=A0A0D7BD98_9AGAR|nr:2-dehydropantoate 2-reductase [Cylindrobasidium torrendii FP15055 ss-10]
MSAQTQTEIFVFGLGAIGSFYAFILNEAGNTQVTVCGRSNYQVLKDHGMTFKSNLAKFGTKNNYRFHGVVKTPAEASSSKFDYVVCANKAITMDPPVSEQIAPVVGEHTTIIVIQNGIGNEEEFQARFPNNTVLSGVTWVGATQVEPGTIIHRDNNNMQFGCHFSKNIDRTQEQARLDKIVDIFRAGGTEIDVVPVIDVYRWKKTIWNGCWNTLTAITQCNTRELLSASPAGPVVARAIMEEMASVAHAQLGEAAAEIDANFIDELLNRPSVKAGIYSSMCQDAKFSRPMEVEVIINGPLKKAKALGIKTPTLETISALISAMDWRFRNGVTGPP